MFQDAVAVVTGGAKGIGKVIAQEFKKAGAHVCVIDLLPNDYFVGDVGDKAALEAFAAKVIADYGRVNVLVNNALPLTRGLDTCTYEEFNQALRVGVTAPFYLTKLFSPCFAPGASIINISSSRDRMSQPQTESYTAAKGGIAALTHALAVSLAGRVRVNSISPGWIDTAFTRYEGPDASQHPAGRVGHPLDIANMVLYLASDKAGFITGENICIDGGMTRQMMIYQQRFWLDAGGEAMKTVICYYSCHHGNTRKVVQAMAEECGATLLDLPPERKRIWKNTISSALPPASMVFRSIHRWCSLPARGCPWKANLLHLYLWRGKGHGCKGNRPHREREGVRHDGRVWLPGVITRSVPSNCLAAPVREIPTKTICSGPERLSSIVNRAEHCGPSGQYRSPNACKKVRHRIATDPQVVKKPFGSFRRAAALQAVFESSGMCGGFGSLAQQGFPARFPGRAAGAGGKRHPCGLLRKAQSDPQA